MVFVNERVTYGVGSTEGYLKLGLFKDVCDVCGFFANVCEAGPFLCSAG
jgi:hypothetical protein